MPVKVAHSGSPVQSPGGRKKFVVV